MNDVRGDQAQPDIQAVDEQRAQMHTKDSNLLDSSVSPNSSTACSSTRVGRQVPQEAQGGVGQVACGGVEATAAAPG